MRRNLLPGRLLGCVVLQFVMSDPGVREPETETPGRTALSRVTVPAFRLGPQFFTRNFSMVPSFKDTLVAVGVSQIGWVFSAVPFPTQASRSSRSARGSAAPLAPSVATGESAATAAGADCGRNAAVVVARASGTVVSRRRRTERRLVRGPDSAPWAVG
ncbi:hypothetical protein [Kitasatospora sp. NPDC087271]|uniref:hypothetical protein n=1 Tax=Kitasatospora sp. NPDC087271 TaxID=3364067 RepID=UPI0037F22443